MLTSFPNYIAIIGDIKGSKKIDNRNKVQKIMKSLLEDINKKYMDDIYSKFTITLGDEFQGLLCCGANCMKILSEIERKLHPIKVRIGVGIGGITTEINREISIGADGPGYYKARTAVEYLKKEEKRKQTNPADIRIEIDGDYKSLSIMLNTILSLMTAIKESWTDRQREIIWDMMEHQDSQLDVAKRLGITQSSVQKGLSNGKYYAYKDAFDTIEKLLEETRSKYV